MSPKKLPILELGTQVRIGYVQPEYCLDSPLMGTIVGDLGYYPLWHGEKYRVYLVRSGYFMYFCHYVKGDMVFNISYDFVDHLGLVSVVEKGAPDMAHTIDREAMVGAKFYKPEWVVMLGLHKDDWAKDAPFWVVSGLTYKVEPFGDRVSVYFHYDDTQSEAFHNIHEAAFESRRVR